MRVLIVEDDKTSRFVLRRILETMDALEIYEAEDGLKAWEMLKGGLLPRLCFLDFTMPKMDGLELLKRIRGDAQLAGMNVCFCSAVRDRQLIVQAAALQPDNYILKPYARSAILAAVQKARGAPRPEESLEPAAVVCSRLGISRETYDQRLDGLLEDVRTLTARLPTLLMQLDVPGALLAMDKTRQVAEDLGVRRIFKLADGLSRSFRADGSLADCQMDSKEETSAKLQRWLSRFADRLMQMMRDMRAELLNIERLLAEARLAPDGAIPVLDAFRGKPEAELGAMIALLSGVFRQGRVLAASKIIRSKPLNVPIKTSFLGEDSMRTVGGMTRRTSFTLTLLDSATGDAVEGCRKINDLMKFLSLPLEGGDRWIPPAALRLLDAELAARNEKGVTLLRNAIGPDFEGFLAQKEAIVRDNLGRANPSADVSDGALEAQVQGVLQAIRQRLQPALDGVLTAHPVLIDSDLGTLAEHVEDVRWSLPLSLLQSAAQLQRVALTDASFGRGFNPSTFDRATFLKAMDVFGDDICREMDPEQAVCELKVLEAVAASPVSQLEKCRLVWGVIQGQTKPGSSLQRAGKLAGV
jgi:two-component system chemotaxis response regulator CheY